MRRMDATRPFLLVFFVLGCVSSAGLAQSSPDRVIIDARLGRQVISELRFEADKLTYERNGRVESAALDGSVVAVVEPSGRAPRPKTSWIELADGQRLVGSPLVLGSSQPADWAVSEGEGLVWATPLLGSVKVPIGLLSRVVLRESETVAEVDELNDVVVLANGDRTRGLLERIWPDVVLDVDGQIRTFDMSAVSSITLANPKAERSGSRVWLSDGSIVAVDSLISINNSVQLDPADPLELAARETALLTIHEVLAVAFASGGVRPLADLGPPAWEALSGWALPPRMSDPQLTLLGSAEVELIGPVAARWDLPAAARRVAVRVRLRDDCRVWGDCEVSVAVVDPQGQSSPIGSHRLHGGAPDATFTVDLPAITGSRVLELRVEEGLGGAIQDRVMVDGFALLSSGAG